ncbi:hypothetical protein T4D_12260 [Trichinella pseudospiralis]|uniref:Uncharacterized protein n=1 Tax=Trichinella pseudospiralis TaxID=6337 RepID=A0A0V1G4H1_TRIPS|nr:hypothetical protein T4D_12260 [Trichinella pseudospiralis]
MLNKENLEMIHQDIGFAVHQENAEEKKLKWLISSVVFKVILNILHIKRILRNKRALLKHTAKFCEHWANGTSSQLEASVLLIKLIELEISSQSNNLEMLF